MSSRKPFYDGAQYDYANSVGHQLFQLLHTMRRDVDRRMAQHGLTDAQWRPVWLLAIGRVSTPLELARELEMDPGAMSRLVGRLAAKGLVERKRSAADRRVVHLRLTPAGEAVAAQVPHVLAAVNNHFLAGFSSAEWRQMLDLIKRMQANGQALPSASAGAAMGAS
jgi:DNA-binding MarR family transcriptional regulator